MRNVTPLTLSLLLLPISALQVPSIFSPFLQPYTEDAPLLSTNTTSEPEQHDLLKRQLGGGGGCPVSYNPCLQNGYGGACCTTGSFCTTDAARNVACCRNGATCTGTLGGVPNTGVANPTTTTNIFGAPTTVGPSTVTYLTNPYFPFPIIATTYPNSAACNVAFQACQTNYAACTANLQGGGFGVTVVAPNGGGVTVNPTAQNLGPAVATSVCSSLSQQACYGIVSENCAQFGTGGNSFIASQTGNVGARVTAGCMAAVGVVAGVGIGIAGQMV